MSEPQQLPWHALLRRSRDHHLVNVLSMRYLVIVPVLLAITTAVVLFIHSDVNVAMLYSQCHARARLPWISHMPLLGAPACFLVSFFGEALASVRAFAIMSVVLSFIASLLTVSTVEAARICNGPSLLIAYPTGPWLVFNLMGGAMVWELLITPAFFHRSKQLLEARERAASEGDSGAGDEGLEIPLPPGSPTGRHMAVMSEVVAIPLAITFGYVLPSVVMLITDSAPAVFVWVFFPVYVSLIRQGVRLAIARYTASLNHTLHLESHHPSLIAVYAVPILCSVMSHGFAIWHLVSQVDDRKEMTRSTIRFIEIDFFFIVLTVLYWILVEAGWRVVAVVLGFSVVLGPGAGLCIGWIFRERYFGFISDSRSSSPEDGNPEGTGSGGVNGVTSEETPLLR